MTFIILFVLTFILLKDVKIPKIGKLYCGPVAIVMAAYGIYSAYNSYQQGQVADSSAKAQADMLEKQGQATIDSAQKQSELVQDAAKFEGRTQAIQAAQLSASQKAALAANGVDLGSVSAQDIVVDTSNMSTRDENAIRYNADSKAWSLQEDAKYKNWALHVEADNTRFAGKQAKRQANTQAAISLVGSALSIAGGLSSASSASNAITTKGATFASAGTKTTLPASKALSFGKVLY